MPACIPTPTDLPAHPPAMARHWLDVARYADNKGYVFQEERRFGRQQPGPDQRRGQARSARQRSTG